MNRHRKKRPRTSKFFKFKLSIFIFISIFILCIFCFLMQFDSKVLPTAISISEKYATTRINEEINNAVDNVISQEQLTSSDFFKKTLNTNEQLNYLSVDTLLINEICSKVASQISKNLNLLEEQKIILPIGIFSGVNFLSNYGPKFSVTIVPMGKTVVDYDTSFEAVGINQINFQIWLNIETEIDIINPLYSNPIIVKRKLMLVNTVFNGEVPSTYLDIPNMPYKQDLNSWRFDKVYI